MASRNAASRKRRGSTSRASSSRGAQNNPQNPIHVLLTLEARERYDKLSHLKMHDNRYLKFDDLDAVGLGVEVREKLGRAGMMRFAEIVEPNFKELTLQFLSTFEFDKTALRHKPNIPGTIKFKIGERRFQMSITEFGIACGFYTEEETRTAEYDRSLLDFPHGVNLREFWMTIARDHQYLPSTAKSKLLHNPALRCIHKLIVHSVVGRAESTHVVEQRDLFFLWCMETGVWCNLGASFAAYYEKDSRTTAGSVGGGSYITRLAKNLGVFDSLNSLTVVGQMIGLNLSTYSKMQLIDRRPDGSYYVVGRNVGADPVEQNVPEEPAGEEDDGDAEGADAEMDALDNDIEDPVNAPAQSLDDQMRALRGDFDAFVSRYDRDMRWMQDSMAAFYQHSGFTFPPPPPPEP